MGFTLGRKEFSGRLVKMAAGNDAYQQADTKASAPATNIFLRNDLAPADALCDFEKRVCVPAFLPVIDEERDKTLKNFDDLMDAANGKGRIAIHASFPFSLSREKKIDPRHRYFSSVGLEYEVDKDSICTWHYNELLKSKLRLYFDSVYRDQRDGQLKPTQACVVLWVELDVIHNLEYPLWSFAVDVAYHPFGENAAVDLRYAILPSPELIRHRITESIAGRLPDCNQCKVPITAILRGAAHIAPYLHYAFTKGAEKPISQAIRDHITKEIDATKNLLQAHGRVLPDKELFAIETRGCINKTRYAIPVDKLPFEAQLLVSQIFTQSIPSSEVLDDRFLRPIHTKMKWFVPKSLSQPNSSQQEDRAWESYLAQGELIGYMNVRAPNEQWTYWMSRRQRPLSHNSFITSTNDWLYYCFHILRRGVDIWPEGQSLISNKPTQKGEWIGKLHQRLTSRVLQALSDVNIPIQIKSLLLAMVKEHERQGDLRYIPLLLSVDKDRYAMLLEDKDKYLNTSGSSFAHCDRNKSLLACRDESFFGEIPVITFGSKLLPRRFDCMLGWRSIFGNHPYMLLSQLGVSNSKEKDSQTKTRALSFWRKLRARGKPLRI